MTIAVGVRELKDSLSHYLRLASEGTSVIVLQRGKPVAILSSVPGDAAASTTAAHLAALAARGLVSLGTHERRRRPRRAPKVDLSGAVLDDRDERR